MSVEERVIKIIAEQTGREFRNITTQMTMEEVQMDPLDIVEAMMTLEEEFLIEISDDDIVHWNTVNDIVEYVRKQLLHRP